MLYSIKEYYCPNCGNRSKQGTNHIGEIYVNCGKCGSSPLYCAEVDALKDRPFIEAKLVYYKFNLDKPEDKAAYSQLGDTLKAKGYALHDALSAFSEWMEIEKKDGRIIRLYNPEQFKGQYVSNIGRVFDWREAVFPNRKIKHGYYLEMISE